MATSYRTFMRALGRKPIGHLKLRTEKREGDIEFAWHDGKHRAYRHGIGFIEDGRP